MNAKSTRRSSTGTAACYRSFEVITVPDRSVGVGVRKPTAACREFIQRRLQALAEFKSP